MQISKWFTTSFTVMRPAQTVDSGGAVSLTKSSAGTFSGHIYSTSGDEVNNYEKKEEEIYFKILCAVDSDILGKDEVNDGTNDYEVLSVLPRPTGNNPHKEILVKLRR